MPAQPLRQWALVAVVADAGVAIQPGGGEDGIDQLRRIAVDDAQRVARLVVQATAFQRQFEVMHALVDATVLAIARALEVAAADQLPRQQFGGERMRGAVCAALGMTQRGDVAGGRRDAFAQHLARIGQGPGAPGHGHAVDVQVGLAQRLQALRAQFGQARIQPAADAAEIDVAGIAQAEYGIPESGQLRCAPAGDEFDQADGVVRRIALALGADDDVQQALAGQLAGGVGIGAQQPYRQSRGLCIAGQLFGGTACVAGLAAVDDGQASRGLRGGRAAGNHRQRRWRMALGHPCGEAGQPPQAVAVQALDQARQQHPAVLWQGAGGHGGGDGGHVLSGLGWDDRC